MESEAIIKLDLRLSLENLGHIVHWTIPFAEVKRSLEKLQPDLIIINYDLRRHEYFPLIRDTLAQQRIPIIYTGLNSGADINNDSELNIAGVFFTPYLVNEIVNLVNKCLKII